MKTRPIFPALSFLLVLVPSTFAMVAGRMSDPEWFKLSNKILVLEYEDPLGGNEGVQVSELIGRMALATGSGIDKLAVVTLRQDEQKRFALTEAKVEELALRQRAPVVIWGEFYKQGERIFVTSHLRYASINTSDDLRPGSNARPIKLPWDISKLNIPDSPTASASLPAAQVNFSPLEISSKDLSSLQDAWSKSLKLHDRPDENSGLKGELELGSPYFITSSSNGWTQVETHHFDAAHPNAHTPPNNMVGWVRLGDLSRLDTFKELTGVVLYAQGLLQASTENYDAAAATFAKYLGKNVSNQDAANQATAHILIGYSILNSSGDYGASLKEFEAAKTLLPDSASPVNCIALALFEKASRSAATDKEMQQLESDLIHVIRVDNDADAIGNLKILYQLPHAAEYFKDKSGDFVRAREIQLKFLRDLEERQLKAAGDLLK